MTKRHIAQIVAGSLAACMLLAVIDTATATQPPRKGGRWPSENFVERVRTFSFNRALFSLARRIQANRAAVRIGAMSLSTAMATGGVAIAGTKSIPVLMATFDNTAANPYNVADLQQQLFDGPWPTGTMTGYYEEISYGQFTVTGTVSPWRQVANNDTFYEGGAGCNGICLTAKTGDLLTEVLDLNDAAIDFTQYDNDGPDGVPNSGDDDGFVDFAAFVHPESGGECQTSNMWSHRSTYSGWTGQAYVTNDARIGGGTIRIDDYVIMPALACDGTTMIQIGVFAHEFGHAFGLPDLYDTDTSNGDSEGIGNWGLMAAGSWGGDDSSPERPSHMSAWSKEFLGWVAPTQVTTDLLPASIPEIETNAEAFKIPISANQHYLVVNRQKKLFDMNLPNAGVLIWKINETVINAGLANNTVNADENNKGVELIQADGLDHLDDVVNRGDGGDVFPGDTGNKNFDNATNPASIGTVAVCAISDPADTMTADMRVSTGTCLPQPQPQQIQVSLVLDPDKRLKKGQQTTARSTVTQNGAPVSGKTVNYSTDNPNLATVSPAIVQTNAAGVAEATVEGQSTGQDQTVVRAVVDGEQDTKIVRVPSLSLIGSALLLVGIALWGRARKRGSSQR